MFLLKNLKDSIIQNCFFRLLKRNFLVHKHGFPFARMPKIRQVKAVVSIKF